LGCTASTGPASTQRPEGKERERERESLAL
jgi:hypothetical protein